MEIRYLDSNDIDQIYNIYHNFFSDMEFPNFYANFHCVFVVHNDAGRIIAVGGIRPIAEAVVLTNKDFPVRERMEALLKILNGVKYSAEKLNYEQVYAFSFDPAYTNHLVGRMGFKSNPENRVLTLEIQNGQEKRRSTTG